MSKNPEPVALPALDSIIERAAALARAREQLGARVKQLNEAIEGLKSLKLPGIKIAVDAAGAAWSALEAEVRAHPELFKRPRKLDAHGIVFGFEKGKGGVAIADAERTLQLIKKHLPDMVDALIASKESPKKDAIAQLTGAELKKIGVELKDTGDVVVIRAADGAIDKLVKALVKSATEDEAEEA